MTGDKHETAEVRQRRESADVRRETADVRPEREEILSSLAVVIAVLFVFSSFFPLSSAAQVLPGIPDQPVGHVNDFAHLLTGRQRQRLESKLRNYRDTTTTVIAIATINSLNGQSKEEVATRLFSQWNLWQGKKDNGVLILIAKKEHKIRIEVGYGLEGSVTDLMAGRIIRNVLSPAFKKGHYYAGLNEATTDIIRLARGEFTGNLKRKQHSGKDNTASAIVFFLFIAFIVYSMSRRGGGKNGGNGRRRRTLGPGGMILLGGMLGGGFGGGRGGGFGGGGGGGFGGFGGGGGFGSGGGGAGGGW